MRSTCIQTANILAAEWGPSYTPLNLHNDEVPRGHMDRCRRRMVQAVWRGPFRHHWIRKEFLVAKLLLVGDEAGAMGAERGGLFTPHHSKKCFSARHQRGGAPPALPCVISASEQATASGFHRSAKLQNQRPKIGISRSLVNLVNQWLEIRHNNRAQRGLDAADCPVSCSQSSGSSTWYPLCPPFRVPTHQRAVSGTIGASHPDEERRKRFDRRFVTLKRRFVAWRIFISSEI